MKNSLLLFSILIILGMMVNFSYERRNLECPMLKCARYCKHGYQLNDNGCQTCRCVDEEVALSDIAEQLYTGLCQKRLCRMACRYGFKRNELGCPICACKTKTKCAQVNCFRYCEQGYILDKNGCRTCGCIGEQN